MDNLFTDLQFIWFSVFVILLTGYAILDGFDLGVGMMHLFSKKDEDRRIMINAIGPLWDGNAVWLVTAGGALFAGFPAMYATVCSAFYLPVMVLLSGLIFRAIAIEFRSKQPMAWWRWFWDIMFSLASLVISFDFGIIVGNLVRGIPLDAQGEFIGDFCSLLNPYALFMGAVTVSLFLMHGVIFIIMKTEGELHDRLRRWVNPAIILFILFYATATMATLIYMPHMAETIKERPIFFLIAVINIFSLANIPREISLGRDFRAFLCSCLNIICLLALFGIGLYPNAVRALNDPQGLSLTIYKNSSSITTLEILLVIACIGMPMVISYMSIVYWIFRGKVKLDATSY